MYICEVVSSGTILRFEEKKFAVVKFPVVSLDSRGFLL
nr:MAG TPA: hypothetical protein [Caudoviricetes sp.]